MGKVGQELLEDHRVLNANNIYGTAVDLALFSNMMDSVAMS